MTPQENPTPTSDERLMATLAHVLGPIVALIIWATQKDKSRFVRFQAMQAIAFDVGIIVVFFLLGGCLAMIVFGATFLGMAGAVAASGNDNGLSGLLGMLFGLIPLGGFCIIFLLAFGVLAARIIAAVRVYQGKNYHYPWLGDRVEKMLG